MRAVASSPAKAILLGEHSVNRGQSALAVSVGLRVRCAVEMNANEYVFSSSQHTQNAAHQMGRNTLLELSAQVDGWREAQNFDAIRQLARDDYFAPAKYIIAKAFGAALPSGLRVSWKSEIPSAGGLGSGGAGFVALAMAIETLKRSNGLPLRSGEPLERWRKSVGELAYLGDVIAHGGIASALDTQTSLLGGVIRYTQAGWGEAVNFDKRLSLVVGNTGVRGQTSEVNTRVRQWLEEDATRMSYFEGIGVLSAAAVEPLAIGDWRTLGKLMNLNQLVLEKIGVSSPELEALNRAALAAGAFGAKLSGSGGGGIMLALVSPEMKGAVAEAIAHAGGEPILPDMAVAGARIEP
jgi:mevalonate kinase